MNDAAILGRVPLAWSYQDRTYNLAVPDLNAELIFQARHEAWTRNRIEATRAMVSAESHLADIKMHGERVASNQFAFGGKLSTLWLCSDMGMVEYLTLISELGAKENGGPALTRSLLDSLRQKDPVVWDDLCGRILRRDFPNLLPATVTPSPSPEAEIPTPSTTASLSSCQESLC